MIAIIDYGMGNLGSVAKAFSAIGAKARVTRKPGDLDEADKIVLPGVGAFGDAMASLKRLKLIHTLLGNISNGKPYLGLCLGMQILFEDSEEGGKIKGLGILEGKVKRFNFTKDVLKVPHMGWNQIKRTQGQSEASRRDKDRAKPPEGTETQVKTKCSILKGVPDNSWMYFVHSYYVAPKDLSIIAANTDYGINFASMIWKDNIYATQFHPEKSQGLGMKILENFVKL